jgi:hypothetical protein
VGGAKARASLAGQPGEICRAGRRAGNQLPGGTPGFPNVCGPLHSGAALAFGCRRGGANGRRLIEECNVVSVNSLGASTNAYSYLQSLLPQQAGDGSAVAADPVTQLLDAFYPNGNGQANADPTSDPSANPPPSGINFAPFSTDMMSTLMSVQEQQSAPTGSVSTKAQSLFAQFDTNGDGSISKSEFENDFGANADTSKVDGLFNALDANGDGSISQSELTSAAQASKSAHAHHHHKGGGAGQGGGGMLDQLMAATQGATSQTDSAADGSTTTTITYADGSKVTMTTPAAASGSQSGQNGASNDNSGNLLEQLISRQAQMLAASASQSLVAA